VSRLRGTLSVAGGVAWRTLHNAYTTPSLLFPGLVFPLLTLVAYAGGLSRLTSVPGFRFGPGYTAFQFVFAFLQSAAFGGVFTGFGIARDWERGFARRLLLAAPHRAGIVLGYALAAAGRFAGTAAVLTVAALAAGMNVDGDGVDLFGLVALALVLNFAGVLWAAGVALRLRTLQAGPLMQTPIFLLIWLSPVYVPLSLLRGWIHACARVNPITYALEAGRGFVAGEPVHVALAFGAAAALAAVFSVWALGGLRRAERAG
jgi:ABC-2 type transport system permease protein